MRKITNKILLILVALFVIANIIWACVTCYKVKHFVSQYEEPLHQLLQDTTSPDTTIMYKQLEYRKEYKEKN
ncbi:MAG: hypothetical protein LBR36_06300 [Bacteroidales bacterium]|jgi:predicted small integral membrane protein|nr:hypothetical protein [Bacteroidales bacterium]